MELWDFNAHEKLIKINHSEKIKGLHLWCANRAPGQHKNLGSQLLEAGALAMCSQATYMSYMILFHDNG